MTGLIRLAVGFACFAGGLTFFVYGLAQSVSTGNCGVDEDGNTVGPPCPEGTGPLIALMIAGVFVAVFGAIAASWKHAGVAVALIVGALVATAAGVYFGINELHPDDTRPGLEVVAASIGPALLLALPALARR